MRLRSSLSKVLLFALTSVVVYASGQTVSRKFLDFVSSEAKLTGLRGAYIVLSTRFIQLQRNGKVHGESIHGPKKKYEPFWANRVTDPALLDCKQDIRFNHEPGSSLELGYFKSYTLFLAGPSYQQSTDRGTLAVIYEGRAENFESFLLSGNVKAIFEEGSSVSVGKPNRLSGEAPDVERADETKLYENFIANSFPTAKSVDCGTYSYTIFEFTE